MTDETSEIINQIKQIAQDTDSTNKNAVDLAFCDIIDSCNKIK